MRLCTLATAALLLELIPRGAARAQGPEHAAYRDARQPVGVRVADLLGRMSLEDKFWQLFMFPGDLDDPANDYSHGVFGLQVSVWPHDQRPNGRSSSDAARAHASRINAIQRYLVENTRLGIPMIPFEEALHGLKAEGATAFPQAIGLAATWDSALVERVAAAAARETRSRGIRQVLSPVVNIANDVRWGRVEETYGEDPFLTSLMARGFVRAFEREGIVATPKHLVANVGDGGRDSYPIDFDERLLEETFFPPFRSAIQDAGAQSVMSAYNSVNGEPATQNHWLLTDVLRQRWGFHGFVISDAAATGGATVLHHTEASTATATKDALDAGLDVIFQSSYEQHRPYLAAFMNGTIAPSVIDTAVARVLRAKFELGLFEHPYVDADSAAYWNGHAAHRALAREAARESIVLLRNAGGTLPLRKGLRSIAVIGEDASDARLGGYSGPGIRPVSILDGIRAAAGAHTAVRFARGPGRLSHDYVVVPSENLSADSSARRGLRAEYFDNPRLAGTPTIVRTDRQVDFGWTLNSPGRGIPYDWYSVRWTGRITVPNGGVRHIGVVGNDGYRLYIGGKLVIDDWAKRSFGARLAPVSLKPGETYDLRLEFFEPAGNARIKLVWDAGVTEGWRASIDSAARLARASDAVIVVAGIEEGEFRDRASLGLPGHQNALIARLAATGKPVVVVLVGGSAITMPWLESVSAVIDAWYPGEEGGDAVADVLFGDHDPAGRLPITFPVAEGQLPLVYDHKPTGRGDDYVDLTGQPLFPFGFGLSYTTFEYSNLLIEPATISSSGSATIRCTVTNTGRRAGDEVAQLYVHDELASVARPVIQLEGASRVHLAPGESRQVVFQLGPEQLRMLDRELHWVVEPGTFRIMVGSSSKDIRLRGFLTVR
ncbi:MAG TPA: glycoside hydrolase family 3 N-terminal domain-containing protein [Gemmatimonadaceae bacterium]